MWSSGTNHPHGAHMACDQSSPVITVKYMNIYLILTELLVQCDEHVVKYISQQIKRLTDPKTQIPSKCGTFCQKKEHDVAWWYTKCLRCR